MPETNRIEYKQELMENTELNNKTERTIKTIITVLSGHAGYIIYKNVNYIGCLFFSLCSFQFNFPELLFVLSLILLPISLFFFHYKMKIGWILLCVFLSFNLISNIIDFTMFLTHDSMEVNTYYEQFSEIDGFSYVLSIILISTIFYFILRPNIINCFNISLKIGLIAVLISALFTLLAYTFL